MTVPLRTFPTGFTMSQIVYGTWRLIDPVPPPTPQEIVDRIDLCVSLGITTFDLADCYGRGNHEVEKAFGEALALKAKVDPGFRSKIQIITKIGIRINVVPEVKLHHYDHSTEFLVKRLQESLDCTGLEYFDACLIHRPSPLMSGDEIAAAMIQLREAGKVRHWGVSNFTPSQFELVQSRLPFKLVTNQIEWSVLNMTPLHDGTLDYLQTHRVPVMAWSPLGGGTLFDTKSTDPKVLRVREALNELGRKYNASADQIAYAWLLAHPAQCFPVLGTNNLDRIRDSVKALDIKLTTEEWFVVWTASAGHGVP